MRPAIRLFCAISLLAVLLSGCSRASLGEQAVCQAILVIDSTPRGATVTLNDALQGKTPLRLLLPPDAATVELTRDGFAPARRTVRLSCEQETRLALALQDVQPPRVTLEASPGPVAPSDGLKVAVTAEDGAGIARVALLVDGAQVAEAADAMLLHNIDTRDLSPGVHQIEARAWDASGLSGSTKAAFIVAKPTATPRPSATPTRPATISPRPTLTRAPGTTPQASPTPAPVEPVTVSRRNIDLPTYAYERALYVDEAKAGHPYPLLNNGWGAVNPQSYELIVLRNAYLEVELLPELGGRIYQIRYLPTDQTLLYNNRVIKPTNWGPPDQGWWLAVGGIEFCLPVDEHGYVTAEPWDARVDELDDGSASVTMQYLEQTRQVAVEVSITLRPGQAALELATRLTSQSDKAEPLQYWINAMVSPGKHGVGPGLRFVLPGSQALVHSTGITGMPVAYEPFSWPVYQGRDLSSYGNWDSYLGLFMPTRTADFVAVYDEDTDIGLVRAFPGAVANGVKLFGFGRGFDANLYTDDGSQYVELWGGWSPTFRDAGNLAPGASVFWRESWYPIVQMDGPTLANTQVALWAERSDDRLTLRVHSPGEQQAVLIIRQGEEELSRQPVALAPTRPLRLELGLRGNLAAATHVLLLRPTGEIIIEHTIVPQGG